MPAGVITDAQGNPVLDADGKEQKFDAEDYSDKFVGFTGAWATTGGNAIIKVTNRRPKPETLNDVNVPEEYRGWDFTQQADGTWTPNFGSTPFSSTDWPIIRLADISPMYTECYINGGAGSSQKALQYINYVRGRAKAPAFGIIDRPRRTSWTNAHANSTARAYAAPTSCAMACLPVPHRLYGSSRVQ